MIACGAKFPPWTLKKVFIAKKGNNNQTKPIRSHTLLNRFYNWLHFFKKEYFGKPNPPTFVLLHQIAFKIYSWPDEQCWLIPNCKQNIKSWRSGSAKSSFDQNKLILAASTSRRSGGRWTSGKQSNKQQTNKNKTNWFRVQLSPWGNQLGNSITSSFIIQPVLLQQPAFSNKWFYK